VTSKSKNTTKWFGIVVALLATRSGLHGQSIVKNGNFADGWNNGPVNWGWTTNIGLSNGGGPNGAGIVYLYGTLFQDLTTKPSLSYHVRFAVSGNSSFPGVSVIGLTWGGDFIGDTSWTSPYTAGDGRNYNWIYGDYTVVADSTSTRISFQGWGTTWEPILSAVSVTVIPEPRTTAVSALGLLALCTSFRHRHMSKLRSGRECV
jgi:hypothetical protein